MTSIRHSPAHSRRPSAPHDRDRVLRPALIRPEVKPHTPTAYSGDRSLRGRARGARSRSVASLSCALPDAAADRDRDGLFAFIERLTKRALDRGPVMIGEAQRLLGREPFGEALLWYGASANALATGYVASAYAASRGRDRAYVAHRHVRFHPGASSTAEKSSANEGGRGRVAAGVGSLERVWSDLLRLGPRRLAALGLAGSQYSPRRASPLLSRPSRAGRARPYRHA